MSFQASVRPVMTRNAECWGFPQNPHNLDGIVPTVVKDPALRLEALLNGEIDLLGGPPFADLDRIDGALGPEARAHQ